MKFHFQLKLYKTKILFTSALFLLLISTNFAQQKISAKDAANYIGKTVTVIDTVSGVYLSKTGTYFINMGGEYPDNAFTAVIFKSDTAKFHAVKSWEGKVVEVTGKIRKYRGKPEIVVGERELVKVKE
jgi:hypothetical protein